MIHKLNNYGYNKCYVRKNMTCVSDQLLLLVSFMHMNNGYLTIISVHPYRSCAWKATAPCSSLICLCMYANFNYSTTDILRMSQSPPPPCYTDAALSCHSCHHHVRLMQLYSRFYYIMVVATILE